MGPSMIKQRMDPQPDRLEPVRKYPMNKVKECTGSLAGVFKFYSTRAKKSSYHFVHAPYKPGDKIKCPKCSGCGYQIRIKENPYAHGTAHDIHTHEWCEHCNYTGELRVLTVSVEQADCEECEGDGEWEQDHGVEGAKELFPCPSCNQGKVWEFVIETEEAGCTP